MDNEQYFKRSWALLTRDKGWIKPLLVMTAANMVPIAGILGTNGYILEWARLTAWGVDSSPKQKNVDVGACIASGWRGVVVAFGWGLALSAAIGLLTLLAGIVPILGSLVALLMAFAMPLAMVLAGTVILVAEIRAAIYERIAAGYRYEHIFEMVKRDTHGLIKVFLVGLAYGAVMGVAGLIISFVIALMFVPFVVSLLSSDSTVVPALTGAISAATVTSSLLGLAFSFFGTGMQMILATAVALWMRQFDVPSWGRSEDPLPHTESPKGPMPVEPMELPEPKSVDELYESLDNITGPQNDEEE